MIEEIKKKVISKLAFKFEYIYERFKKETGCTDEEIVLNVFLDTAYIITNYIHVNKICIELETTLLEMAKDYYYFNKYDIKKNENSEGTSNETVTSNTEIKSITRGEEKIEFAENKNITTINGTRYSTGTIEFSDDTLIKKYSNRLNKHRKMRW